MLMLPAKRLWLSHVDGISRLPLMLKLVLHVHQLYLVGILPHMCASCVICQVKSCLRSLATA